MDEVMLIDNYRKHEMKDGTVVMCRACHRPDTQENKTTATYIKVEKTLVPIEDNNTPITPWMSTREGKQQLLQKHLHNLKLILDSTNATMVHKRSDNGYMCCYCPKAFQEPINLKVHTLTEHQNEDKFYYKIRSIGPEAFLVKLDITKLQCTICSANIDSLDDIFVHLTENHNKNFHTDIKNQIFPFKFNTKQMKCCLCTSDVVFATFRRLQEHMHKHYRYFICDVCDAGFINHQCFSSHSTIHTTGTFVCRHCPATFDNVLKRSNHEVRSHTQKGQMNRCHVCNESFKEHYLKVLHLSTAHGLTKTYNCTVCDRNFTTNGKLRVHVRRFHLMERNHKCSECDRAFFTPRELKQHIIQVHTRAKDFKCDVCSGNFAKKYTLTQHMKIHNDDKQHMLDHTRAKDFKCDVCSKNFAKKSTLTQHKKIHNDEKRYKDIQEKMTTATDIKVEKTLVPTEENNTAITRWMSTRERKQQLLQKHLHNLKLILESTNATMVHKHSDNGYMCCYCPKAFQEPINLKVHTLTKHQNEDKFYYKMRSIGPEAFLVKLDITKLQCTICMANIDSLDDIFVHLTENHNKNFHTDIKNQIFPFKFNTKQMKCCLCTSDVVFATFRRLQEHMHKHYRYLICDVCDAGFINHQCFTNHIAIHTTGTFVCRHCPATFDNVFKRSNHEVRNHTQKGQMNRCHVCNESFKEHYLKVLHLSSAHGVTKTYNCTVCDRKFTTNGKLRVHIRRFHLMERNHKCSDCDRAFFTVYELKKHMLVHTGAKDFKCDVCFKNFAMKSTLSKHMKIHNDVKRYECTICHKAFVQKPSLNLHMRTKH